MFCVQVTFRENASPNHTESAGRIRLGGPGLVPGTLRESKVAL